MKPQILAKWVRGAFRPVQANKRTFVVLVLLGILGPWLFALVTPGHIYRALLLVTLQGVAWGYILCALLMLFKGGTLRNIVRTILVIGFAVGALAEVITVLTTGNTVTIDEINLFFETNTAEATGFFQQYFSWKTMAAIIGCGAFVGGVAYCSPRLISEVSHKRILKIFGRLALLCCVVLGVIRIFTLCSIFRIPDYYTFLIWEAEPRFGNPELNYNNQIRFADITDKLICYSKEYHLQNAEYAQWDETQRQALASNLSVKPDREFNIVVIIGESYIRQHSSLYGYYLPTDPCMKAEADSGRVNVFTNMIAPANFTTYSLRNLLNLNDLAKGERWADGVYFPYLMRKSGRNVYHYDNQTVTSGRDAGISKLFYNDFNLRNTYNSVSDRTFNYDGDFLNYLTMNYYPQEEGDNKLVIYHLMGQHFPAEMRYPGDGPFCESDIAVERPWLNSDRRKEVAQYDNATYYTDSIVATILQRYKSSKSIVIYFSDHGEDCWDLAPCEARNNPHPSDDGWIDRQFHIPFFVWTSDSFRETHSDLSEALRWASTKPGTLDNLGQMVLGLSGIESEYYNPSLDITSRSYQPPTRITVDGYRIADQQLAFP